MASISYRDPNTGSFVPFPTDNTPTGTIMGWGGSAAPAGWFICDGSAHGSAKLAALIGANTPDLRGRFIVGSGASHAVGATGGAATVVLTAAQCGIPAHGHGASSGTESVDHIHTGATTDGAGGHHHSSGYIMTGAKNTTLNKTSVANAVNWPVQQTGAQPASGAHNHTGTSGGINVNHGHGVTINAAGAANASEAHENRPPFYAMVFIIKGT